MKELADKLKRMIKEESSRENINIGRLKYLTEQYETVKGFLVESVDDILPPFNTHPGGDVNTAGGNRGRNAELMDSFTDIAQQFIKTQSVKLEEDKLSLMINLYTKIEFLITNEQDCDGDLISLKKELLKAIKNDVVEYTNTILKKGINDDDNIIDTEMVL